MFSQQVTEQRDIEHQLGGPPGVLTSFYDEIAEAGYLRRDGSLLTLTEQGETVVNTIDRAWRDWLLDEVSEWLPPQLVTDDDGLTVEQRPDVEDEAFREKVKASVTKIARRAMMEQHQEAVSAREREEDESPLALTR